MDLSWGGCLASDALQDGQLVAEACCFAEADLLSKPVAASAGGSTELDLDTWCLLLHKWRSQGQGRPHSCLQGLRGHLHLL